MSYCRWGDGIAPSAAPGGRAGKFFHRGSKPIYEAG